MIMLHSTALAYLMKPFAGDKSPIMEFSTVNGSQSWVREPAFSRFNSAEIGRAGGSVPFESLFVCISSSFFFLNKE